MGLTGIDPLYDFSSSFWDNYRKGPRKLSAEEARRNETVQKEISELRGTGASLERSLFGRRVDSPVALASGPAPNADWLQFFSSLGYDILSHKTVRDRYWEGHPLPNLMNVEGDFVEGFREADGVSGTITNSLGMPSASPAEWKREVRSVLSHCPGRFVIVSVTATVEKKTTEDELVGQFSELAREVKKTGAHAVELNLSCPNVASGEGGEIYTQPKLCGRIVEAVRDEVSHSYPVLLKSGFLEDYAPMTEETAGGMIGYVVINSIAARVVGKDGSLPFASRGGRAGIAGAAVFGFTKRAVGSLQKLREKGGEFEILAVGGVTEPGRAVELAESGADVVEAATGAILRPSLALEIKRALLKAGGGER